MLSQTTIWEPLFLMAYGALLTITIIGARSWFTHLNIKMNWWKWLVFGGWYAILLLSISASFTLLGEGERRGGLFSLGFFGMICLILGVGVWRLLTTAGNKKDAA